jgi:hypothetical protein
MVWERDRFFSSSSIGYRHWLADTNQMVLAKVVPKFSHRIDEIVPWRIRVSIDSNFTGRACGFLQLPKAEH